MKIGFDSKRLFCNQTGLGNYSRTLLRNLATWFPDYEYHLYSPELRATANTDHFLTSGLYKPHQPKGSLKALWRSAGITRQLADDRIELYHGLSHEIPFGLKRKGIRSVVTMHDLIFRVHPETYTAADRTIYDLKFRYACAHADRILAISQSTANDIVRFYGTDPSKIDIVYQACNPVYYAPSNPEENQAVLRSFGIPTDYLLYIGTVEPRKNLRSLLLAFPMLSPSLRLPLVVVGRGGRYLTECRKLAVSTGLEDRVIWIDGLSDLHQIRALYTGSRIVLYPSLYEGFGLPVAEALLCRVPVITSNRSSLPEAGGPGTWYVDPTQPEAIADGITNILTDSELQLKMITSGYEYAQRMFSAEKVTGEVVGSYLRVMAAGSVEGRGQKAEGKN